MFFLKIVLMSEFIKEESILDENVKVKVATWHSSNIWLFFSQNVFVLLKSGYTQC